MSFRFPCLLLPLMLLPGCVQAYDVAKTRAASDFDCDEDKVTIEEIGGTSYRAKGCGKKAVYDCSESDSYRGTTTNYNCRPEGPIEKKSDY